MKTLMGVTVAVALIVVACEVPGPQSVVAPKPMSVTTAADVLSERNVKPPPLTIIDGVRLTGTAAEITSALKNQNVHDIESIEIVKGPSAVALYGVEANNGVMIIKTKRGKP